MGGLGGRLFGSTPTEVDAVHTLGIERAVVFLNVRALLETGVLVHGHDPWDGHAAHTNQLAALRPQLL